MQVLKARAAAKAGPCAELSSVLSSVGVPHTCQAVTPDGGLIVDLLIQQPGQQVALSFETFVRNTGKRRGEPGVLWPGLTQLHT